MKKELTKQAPAPTYALIERGISKWVEVGSLAEVREMAEPARLHLGLQKIRAINRLGKKWGQQIEMATRRANFAAAHGK